MKRVFTKWLLFSLLGVSTLVLPAAARDSTTGPGGPSLSSDEIVGQVEKIDPANRTFTVETNRGQQNTLWVSYGSQIIRNGSNTSFENLRVGDKVAIRYPNNAPHLAWDVRATSSQCTNLCSNLSSQ